MWGGDVRGGVGVLSDRTVLKSRGKLESGTLTLCSVTQEPGSLYQ